MSVSKKLHYALLFILILITGLFTFSAPMIGMRDEFGFGQARTWFMFIELPIFGFFYACLLHKFYFKFSKSYPYVLKILLFLQLSVVLIYRILIKKLPLTHTFLTEFNTEHVHLAAHQHMSYPFYITGIVCFCLFFLLIQQLWTKKPMPKSMLSNFIFSALSLMMFSYHVFQFNFYATLFS